ncbi:MAG TPA: hypothetical protein VFJ17_09170 [Mycobacteriales bacterium]|jgi:hypothetical protein|nr:hypothetical protein [Mycobacteriales bacterium]
MTARRLAIWWRLLLAAGLLGGAIATSAAATSDSTNVAHQTFTVAATQSATPIAAPTAQRAALHHARHLHRSAPILAAVAAAGVGFVVLLVSVGVGRRRTSQLLGASRHWWSSRAPPYGTGPLVLFGHASGRAGRLSRSRRALFPGTIPVHC